MQMQGTPNRAPKAVLWIVLIVLVAGVIGLSYYVYQQDNGNSNANANQNANTSINGNANGNANANTMANQNVNAQGNRNNNSVLNANASPGDWKTYTNPQPKFKIAYPPDWELTARTDLAFIIAEDGQGADSDYQSSGITIRYPGWRADMPEGGGVFNIQYLKITSEQFITAFNSDGDSESQVTQPSTTDLLDNVAFDHVTAGTAIGLDWHFLIPVNPELHPFIIKFDQYDSVQNDILKTIELE